jgi:outer membrane protein assembly factor BamD (BamD/ComL family)
MINRLLMAAALACVGVVGAPSMTTAQTQAQAEEAFREGIQARNAKRWEEAAKRMREAIQRDGNESVTRKVRTGGGLNPFTSTEYLPYYFLGEALYNREECAGAIGAWEVSEQQKAVSAKKEFVAVIQKGYAECAKKGILPPSEYAPLHASTQRALEDVNVLATRLRNLGQANIDIWQQEMTQRYETARGEVVNGQTRFTNAMRTRLRSDFIAAREAADRAATSLRTLETNLTAAIRAAAAIQQSARDVEAIFAEAEANDRAAAAITAPRSPEQRSARDNGMALIVRGRDRLATGTKTQNAAAIGEARELAVQAVAILKKLHDDALALSKVDLRARIAEALAVATQSFSQFDSSLAALDRLVVEKPDKVRPELAAERAAVLKEIESARRRVESTEKAQNLDGLQVAIRSISEATAKLDTLLGQFPRSPEEIAGPQLAAGFKHFIAGEYQQAVAALDPAQIHPGAPLEPHGYLLRAASLHALYVRSGETNAALRAQALDAVDRCKALNPTLAPDPGVFSPRFISFYQAGRTAAQAQR